MPALSGQVITTITDENGVPAVTVTWFWDPATMLLRNNPTPWTAPDGTVWPAEEVLARRAEIEAGGKRAA